MFFIVKEKTSLYFLSIVGIVAVVGIVILVFNSGKIAETAISTATETETIAGEAIKVKTSPPCIDTDSGYDIYEKGTASFMGVKGKRSLTDSCVSNTEINESYCSRYLVTSNITDCPTDYICDDGACVKRAIVYLGGYNDGQVYAVYADDGTDVWRFNTHEVYEVTPPTVVEGVVYIGSRDYNVYALDADDGTVLWEFNTGGYVRTTPAVVDGVVYIGSQNGYLYALDADDGTSLWELKLTYPGELGSRVAPRPTVVDGIMYIGYLYDAQEQVSAIEADDGTIVWTQEGKAGGGSPTVDTSNNLVFVGKLDGIFYALDIADGEEVWRYSKGFGGEIQGTPAVADGVVYYAAGDIVFALNAADGSYLWSYTTGASIDSGPIVDNGVVYIGSHDGYLYALDADDATDDGTIAGTLLFRVNAGEDIYRNAAVFEDMVYFTSENHIWAADIDDATDDGYPRGTILWSLVVEEATTPAVYRPE